MTTESIVWVSLDFESADAINVVRFDYHFLSEAAGLLSVYFGGEEVFSAEELTAVEGGESSGLVWLGADFEPGEYTVRFQLDPSGTDQSSVRITEIEVGLAPDSEPTANIPAVSEWGLIVMTLLVLTAGTLVYARSRPIRT